MGKVIVVVGPTAVGKTKISIELAKYFSCEIISGDSVAVYKRLDIGSAKPTISEQSGIKHHLIDIIDAGGSYSVADFQKAAREIIDRNELSIICGGTGLYVQSALYNYEFNASARNLDYGKKYEAYSNEELYKLLLSKDSNIDKEKLHPNNRKRVLRALEVIEELDTSIHSFDKKNEPIYDYYIAYLSMPREELYERINQRVDVMINSGLIDEVKSLYDDGIYPHTIGYQEFIPYFNGDSSLESTIEEIKKNTRHLAKRQETWFRNQMDSHFYNVDVKCIENTIEEIKTDIIGWLKK
ncbi:MAG: tRNA (adenosine(37)-N6)-dimethylallyltransferase MiaA [Erysipelotrichaceae bacterium]|nr:tRNA (adenosine(37)-N6)-dimethylallyltransferase MiaA [Erysipelotrichaceae bacterium]